jgi:hypothetical protein
MMSPKDISGLWKGAYFYDHTDLQQTATNGVSFELSLTQTRWQRWFGEFAGTVTDDVKCGLPGIGEIQGRVTGDHIRFSKTMPICYLSSEGRLISLSDYLRKNGFELGCDFPHPPVKYEGVFSSATDASGTWLIEEENLVISHGVELLFPRNSGTFSLHR